MPDISHNPAEFSHWSYGRLLKYISILESGRAYDPSPESAARLATAISERERRLAWAADAIRRFAETGMSVPARFNPSKYGGWPSVSAQCAEGATQ